MYDSKTNNLLNDIKLNEGREGLATYFNKLMKQDLEKAFNLLNNDNLHFGSLFIIKSTFEESKLFTYLNERNQIALRIMNELEELPQRKQVFDGLILNYIQTVYSVLKWIFETGRLDDGLSNEYDRAIDTAAGFLVKLFRNKNILPHIADMIFKRHELGLYIHDLVWAFFEGRDANSLVYIANGLKSGNGKNNELASKLLNFIPVMDLQNSTRGEDKYQIVVRWLNENAPYLLFTGEGFNETGKPIICRVALDAKYISKKINNETGNMIEELGDNERRLLEEFNELDYNTREFLSNYSHRLQGINIHGWTAWLNHSIEEQIRISLAGDYYDKNFR